VVHVNLFQQIRKKVKTKGAMKHRLPLQPKNITIIWPIPNFVLIGNGKCNKKLKTYSLVVLVRLQ